MLTPNVPTTPEQWKVIAWGAIALLVVLGTAGLYLEWRAPNVEAADRARYLNVAAWGLALAIYVFKRVLTRVLT